MNHHQIHAYHALHALYHRQESMSDSKSPSLPLKSGLPLSFPSPGTFHKYPGNFLSCHSVVTSHISAKIGEKIRKKSPNTSQTLTAFRYGHYTAFPSIMTSRDSPTVGNSKARTNPRSAL